MIEVNEVENKHIPFFGIKAFFVGIIYLVGIWYISFEVIMPLILPVDPCYYHMRDTPVLIDFFYMGLGSNGHPEGSLMHIFLIVILSFFLGRLTVKKYSNY